MRFASCILSKKKSQFQFVKIHCIVEVENFSRNQLEDEVKRSTVHYKRYKLPRGE